MEGFVGMREDLELASFLDGEPVDISQVGGDVCPCVSYWGGQG